MARAPKPPSSEPWSRSQEKTLRRAFRDGLTPEDIAGRMAGRTPGAVRWKLNELGLGHHGPKSENAFEGDDGREVMFLERRRMRGDLAFKRALLAAIKSGAEKVCPCVMRARAPRRFVPPLRAEGPSHDRASAARAAEMGDA